MRVTSEGKSAHVRGLPTPPGILKSGREHAKCLIHAQLSLAPGFCDWYSGTG